jgi:hypothetical protein
MTQPSLELLKRQITKILGRSVEVEKTRSGRYICRYVDFGMSPISLVGESEAEAYQKLLQYLQKKEEESPEPDSPRSA